MLKSLYSGVSGIQAHQLKIDVIGNNIANVNTVGYKRGDVVFQELLSQTIRGASSPTENIGGTNPMQVGLGVQVGSITTQFTQGNLQYTGSNTDMSIEGNGFFIVADGSTKFYTRAGSFALDRNGNLIHSSNGMMLQGWMADDTGTVNTNYPISGISVPIGKVIPAKETSTIKFEQNLDSRINGSLAYQPSNAVVTDQDGEKAQISVSVKPGDGFNKWNYEVSAIGVDGSTVTSVSNSSGGITLDADGNVISSGSPVTITFSSGKTITIQPPLSGSTNGGKFTVSSSPDTIDTDISGVYTKPEKFENTVSVYDSLGGVHNIKISFSKIDDNIWSWSASAVDGGMSVSGTGNLVYDPNTGKLVSSDGAEVTINYGTGIGISKVKLDFANSTQFASNNSMLATEQDGYASGALQNFSIDQFGCVNGVFSNGVIKKVAQIALANFSNPSGLTKAQGSFFTESNNSGVAYIGTSGTGGRGRLISGNLETSNVDLSREFTDLITTQRGYQANARLITSSDELLQELINIKR